MRGFLVSADALRRLVFTRSLVKAISSGWKCYEHKILLKGTGVVWRFFIFWSPIKSPR